MVFELDGGISPCMTPRTARWPWGSTPGSSSAALDERGRIRIVYYIELDHALAGRNTFDIQIRQARR